MTDAIVTCISCYSPRHSDVLESYGHWTLYECLECGVRYFWPAKNPGADWYQESDIYLRRDAMAVDWMWYHEAGLEMLPAAGGRLLDVGCGTGGFVAAARSKGFNAIGIDFSPAAIAAGRRWFGLDALYCMSIEQVHERFGDGSFEVITAFEVLEHMDDVGQFMRQVHRLLAPGGRLILSVPNRDRRPRLLNEGDLPPHHFTRWDAMSMRQLLERHTLTVRDLRVCPANVTIKSFLLFYVRFGLVVRLLGRRRDAEGDSVRASLQAGGRALARLKDRLAGAVAEIPALLLGGYVRGPMLVASADRQGESGQHTVNV